MTFELILEGDWTKYTVLLMKGIYFHWYPILFSKNNISSILVVKQNFSLQFGVGDDDQDLIAVIVVVIAPDQVKTKLHLPFIRTESFFFMTSRETKRNMYCITLRMHCISCTATYLLRMRFILVLSINISTFQYALHMPKR